MALRDESTPKRGRGTPAILLSLAIAAAAAALLFGGVAVPHADANGAAPAVSAAPTASAPVELQGSCGDGRCNPPEDCNSCPSDCGDCCGDGRCSPPEDCNSCPSDCGGCCGDGRCNPPEDRDSCPRDCR